MTYLLIRHRVAEFTAWKKAFDAHAPARAAGGLKDKDVLHEVDEPNQVVLLFEVTDMAKAKEFANSADLQSAMKGAGVTDKPDVLFLTRAN